MSRTLFGLLLSLLVVAVTACQPATPQSDIVVLLQADGRERTFNYTLPITVGEFLSDAEVELGELDRVNPQPFTQITNGMVVTVVRIEEETECVEEELPYRQRTVLNEGLAPGEERIGQPGQNGTERICYRVRIEDGNRQDPVETSRVVITAPQDEIVYVGPTGEIDPVPIDGTLAYISNRNVWMIRGSSVAKKPVTTTGDLDETVLALSNNGENILFTQRTPSQNENTPGFANQLWLATDLTRTNPSLVELVPQDVLQAGWIPGLENTISYSTAESSETAPGWRAYNDLWAMRIDLTTGEALRVEELIPASSFGLYSWWGTNYVWSNDGSALAWIRADSIGLYNLETSEFETLVDYPVFNTRQSWSWRATASWSADNALIATTIHVAVGNYPPETSPAFSVAITAADGSFYTPVVDNSGIWSVPVFSNTNGNGTGYLAYLKARDPFNSISGEYDLMVADQDGSNARAVFPTTPQAPGVAPHEFVWSPNGRQIALIYQGNLWVVDVETNASHQLTLDGGASRPVWK